MACAPVHSSTKPLGLSCRNPRNKFVAKVRRSTMGKNLRQGASYLAQSWPRYLSARDPIDPTHWLRCACKRVMSILLPCQGNSSMRKADNFLKVSTCLPVTESFCFYLPPPSTLNRLQVFLQSIIRSTHPQRPTGPQALRRPPSSSKERTALAKAICIATPGNAGT